MSSAGDHLIVARGPLEDTMTALGGSNYPYTSLQQFAVAIVCVFPALASIVVSLRIYVRLTTKSFGWDDGLILVAILFSVASIVPSYFYIKTSYTGIHDEDAPPRAPDVQFFWLYLCQLFYQPVLTAVKASVLVFMLRLGRIKMSVRYACWALIVVNILAGTALLLACLLQCVPIHTYWQIKMRKMYGSCFKMDIFSVSSGGINVATDLATLSVPFIIFLGLRVQRRVKVCLLVVFSLGVVVVIMSGVRLFYLCRQLWAPQMKTDKHYSIGFVTTAAESNLAIMTACAPALWPLARRWFPGVFSRMALSQAFKQDELATIRNTAADRSTKTRSWDSHKSLVGPRSSSGMYANSSVGGSSHTFGPSAGRSRAEMEARRARGSQEEMAAKGSGIVHTTKVWVKYDGDRSWEPPSPSTLDLEAHLDEDAQLHPIELEPVYLCDYHQHIRAEARRSRSPL